MRLASHKIWYLQMCRPPVSSPSVVPPAVAAVAACLLGQEAGVDPQRAARLRLCLGNQGWVVVHAVVRSQRELVVGLVAIGDG